ncbi:Hint domain-containing protein [Antarctobacter sp.]|uniref:Hint domain-containing protein n=1 Tax=Antarctobacter sp. TaxID=1872577 RepID=UPI002B26B574|nr:Hint domain-containing protein [Antarctobacter sp.]
MSESFTHIFVVGGVDGSGNYQLQGPNAISSTVSDGADGVNDTSTAVGDNVTWTVSSGLASGPYELVGLTVDGDPVLFDGSSAYVASNNPTLGPGVVNASSDPSYTYCFAAGTLIATPTGDIPVETLTIGDTVLTAAARPVPVRWIGRQTLRSLFSGPGKQLVRIRAGALGDGLPYSDLTVTADHGMILDGHVINASALINGTTIDFAPLAELEDSFTVYHVETEAHDVILANGAPSETFIDYRDRRAFDNFNEYLDLYGVERIIPEMARPRISSRRMLPQQIRDCLEPVDASVAPDLARLA